MLHSRLSSLLMMLVVSSAASAGLDLTTIERKLAKEPAYRAKPKYCLLVFGPESKTRIWLVQDGDTLYVDRNGNGEDHGVSRDIVVQEAGHAGYRLIGEYDFVKSDGEDYFLVFEPL